MEKTPNDIPDETDPPEDFPLIIAESLEADSGISLSELRGLTRRQLEILFDDPDLDHEINKDPTKTEEIKQKNLCILREKIKEIKSV